MKHDKDHYWIFSSGRKRYGFTEKLSIEFEDGKPRISYGYDGGFWDAYEFEDDYHEPAERLTKEDLKELAELQVQRWQQFIEWLGNQEEVSR